MESNLLPFQTLAKEAIGSVCALRTNIPSTLSTLSSSKISIDLSSLNVSAFGSRSISPNISSDSSIPVILNSLSQSSSSLFRASIPTDLSSVTSARIPNTFSSECLVSCEFSEEYEFFHILKYTFPIHNVTVSNTPRSEIFDS